MESVELFYAIFNVLIGILMLLVCFGVLKLGKPISAKLKWFFGLAGVFMLLWGIYNISKDLL